MPSAISYIPATDTERQQYATAADKERQRRTEVYETALKYYMGEHDQQLQVLEETDPNDNTYINMVQMTADRTIQFLFPEMPDMETAPDSIDDTPEEEYLEEFFEVNGGLHTLTKLGLRGFLSGHAFVRVKPPKSAKGWAKLVVLDPTTVSVFWKADDVGDVLWYEQRYMVGGSVFITDYVKSEDEQSWTIYTYKAQGATRNPMTEYPTNNGNFYLDTDLLDFANGTFELVDTQVHTSPIAPIVEFAHLPHPDDYYGLSEFTQKDLQDTINRINSERNRIVRENSDPVDVITGADVDDVEGDGGLLTIANAQARVNRLEMKGDLNGITGVLDKLIETYLAISRVVLLKGEAKDLQRVTNASVRTLFLDALAKNSLLQSSYGHALKKVAKLALMMGYANNQIEANPVDIDVEIHFGSPLPVDQTEVANINTLGLSGGYMSEYTAAIRLGLDPKFEKAHRDTEMQENMKNQEAQMSMAAKFAQPTASKDNPQQNGKPTKQPPTTGGSKPTGA